MEISLYRTHDTKTHLGCDAAHFGISYPRFSDENMDFLNNFIENKAKAFSEFVKNTAFDKAVSDLKAHIEEGKRRSAFPLKEYTMNIRVISEHDKYISLKDEIILLSAGIIKAYILEYSTWDTKNRVLCPLSEFIKKNKQKCDGFYLKDGTPHLYKLTYIWKEKDCKLRDKGLFITELNINNK